MVIDKKRLLSIVGIVVGIILIAVWLFAIIKNESDIQHAERIISYNEFCLADVVSSSSVKINETSRRKGDTYSRVYVSYSVDGVSYDNVYAGVTKWRVQSGEKLMIYYDPSNPQDCVASVSGFGFYTQMYSYMFAAGVVIIAISILPPILLKRKRKQELKYSMQREEMIKKNSVNNLYYTDYNDNSENDKY